MLSPICSSNAFAYSADPLRITVLENWILSCTRCSRIASEASRRRLAAVGWSRRPSRDSRSASASSRPTSALRPSFRSVSCRCCSARCAPVAPCMRRTSSAISPWRCSSCFARSASSRIPSLRFVFRESSSRRVARSSSSSAALPCDSEPPAACRIASAARCICRAASARSGDCCSRESRSRRRASSSA